MRSRDRQRMELTLFRFFFAFLQLTASVVFPLPVDSESVSPPPPGYATLEVKGRRRTADLLEMLDQFDLFRPALVNHRGEFLARVPHTRQLRQESNSRHRRDTGPSAPQGHDTPPGVGLFYKLTAYDREFLLNLSLSIDLAPESLSLEIWNGSDVTRTRREGGVKCHYVGHLVSEERTSRAAISNCNGLHGVFSTAEEEYLVEPYWGELGGNPADRHLHIIYRRSDIKKARTESHCGLSERMSDSWLQRNHRTLHGQEYKANWTGIGLGKTVAGEGDVPGKGRRKRSAISKRSYVETLVVVDKEMVAFHGIEHIEAYVLTTMNIVAKLFRDESIGHDINIVVTRIIILTTSQPGLEISYHADRSLESFCLWQNRINSNAATLSNRVDQEIPNHDNAILLTRYDICTYRNMPCGTLGLAPVAGMCESDRSCSINEDIGLATAFTIAHELGHNFGMQHDGAGNQCGTPGHESAKIMASQLARNREPFSWSGCSRNYLTNFLDAGKGKCLENFPLQKTFRFPDRLAGEIHDGDSQCQLTHGPYSTQCKKNEGVCLELWCINPKSQECVTSSIPPAEGTPCFHDNDSPEEEGWCYRGRCVRSDWRPQPVDGQWGEWSSWGQCSRTCGGGVDASERKCDSPRPAHGGKFCTGERLRYRSCSIHDCPPDSTDFRELQCAKFNEELFRNKFFKWKPFTGGHVRPCALNCLAIGYNFYTERASKVRDGTRCYPDSMDICVNGECRSVGCDRILGSNAVEDKCRVCGGNGSTCETIQGRVDQPMSRDASDTYVEVTRVPHGAIHIRFAETRLSKNYLALKSDSDIYHINGAWTIDWPRSFEVAGTIFRYERPKDRPETLTAIGPTSEDLFLMILVQESYVSVDFEYNVIVKKETQSATSHPVYIWQHLPWNECSVTCGKGFSRSMVGCIRMSDASPVKEMYCTNIRPRPEDRIKYCNVADCPPEWGTGEWSDCSRSCGGGLKVRRILCTRRVSQTETEVLDPDHCPAKRPKYKLRCNEEACPADWHTDEWSECRPPCGGVGIRTRNIFCVDPQVNLMATDHCDPSTKPVGQEKCQMTMCPAPRWTTGAWGECSSRCDKGVSGGYQMRTVACRTYNGEPSVSCDPRTMPVNRQECHGHCAGSPVETRRSEECTDINKVEYCPLVLKFRFCSRPYFQQMCCQTCSAERT